MPPQLLYDISHIDLNQVVFDQEAIREVNPQRGDMEHLDAIAFVDAAKGQIIGYKDVRDDEFWIPGHIPGNPLLPGVIMIEAGPSSHLSMPRNMSAGADSSDSAAQRPFVSASRCGPAVACILSG